MKDKTEFININFYILLFLKTRAPVAQLDRALAS